MIPGRSRSTDRWCDAALCSVTLSAVVICLAAYARTRGSGFGPLWLQVAVIVYLPGLAIVHRQSARGGTRAGLLVIAVLAFFSAAVFLIAGGPGGVLPVTALALLWLVGYHDRPAAAAGTLGLAFFAGLLGASLIPGRVWMIVIPALLVQVVLASLLLHARTARAPVARRGADGALLGEGGLGRWLRLAGGLSLSLTVLLVALCLVSFQVRVIELHRLASEPDLRERQGGGFTSPNRPRLLAGGPGDAFPDELASGGFDGANGDVRLARVVLRDPREGLWVDHGRPFLLRGGYLDVIDEQGFSAGEAPVVARSVGVGSEWLTFTPGPPGDLEIHVIDQRPMAFRGHHSLLFGGDPWVALRFDTPMPAGAPLLELGEGVYALSKGPPVLDYAVSTRRDRFEHALLPQGQGAARLAGRRASHPDSRWRALPINEVRRLGLERLAAAIAAAAGDDLARVRAVVDHLRLGYRYASDVPFRTGFADIEQLIGTGAGRCTHFAAAAAVMLRSLDLPARIATGFLCQDYDDDARAYGVWDSNRHAWVEVHFDGYGWVPFDVTPPAALEALVTARGHEPAIDDEAVAAAPLDSLPALLEHVMHLPARLMSSLAPAVWIALSSGIVGLWLALRFARGRRRGRLAVGDGWPAELAGHRARLERALLSLGHRRGRGQTPREFADEVVRHEGDTFAPLQSITRWFDRARFGARPLQNRETAEVEAFLVTIEELARARRSRVRVTPSARSTSPGSRSTR